MSLLKHNFPSPNDPKFPDKLVDLVRTLFEQADNPIKSLGAIASTPEKEKQYGDIWYDSTEKKIKVYTPDGVKIVKYE